MQKKNCTEAGIVWPELRHRIRTCTEYHSGTAGRKEPGRRTLQLSHSEPPGRTTDY